MIGTAVALLGALGASPATAQDAPGVLTASTTTPTTTTSTTLPTPVASTAGKGVYGAPLWLPLRRDLPGTEVTVGCTYDSHGSQHGYECSGHHSRWALDFLADTGTPVYAAGAGFATNLTGKPGGSGFGNVVRIDHGFGISTVYAHLSKVLIPAEGAWVDETTQLGNVGMTGSASAPHLHFEVFSVPTPDTDIGKQVSIDPGPLFACRGDLLVSFPQVAGIDSWKGLPWGSLTVASDGHDCLEGAVKPAPPAVPVPSPEPADTSTATAGPTDPWSQLITQGLDIVVLTAQRLPAIS